jgi:hypothetical protein
MVARCRRRHIDLPLYHLDSIVNSVEYRNNKIASLDAFAPSVALSDGRSISDVYYQPEQYSRRDPEPVDPDDADAIRRVLAAASGIGESIAPNTSTGMAGRRASLTTATVKDIRQWWPLRSTGESLYRGEVRITGSPLSVERDISRFRAGEQRLLLVGIANFGEEVWDCDLRGAELYLASRWSSHSTGEGLESTSWIEGDRVPLTSYVHPGGRDLLLLSVRAPTRPGRYVLNVDLLHEHVRWFGCGPKIDVLVSPSI